MKKILIFVIVALSMLNFQQSHAGIFKGDDKEKKEMEVSSESSFLQSNTEDGSFFYPGGSEELSDAPIGLPVDASLMVALFLALLCVSYAFIKQQGMQLFCKYIIRYSTINTHRCMKKIFLLIAVCGLVWSATAQKTAKNSSEEIWVLDKVEVNQILQAGDTVSVPYNPEDYANSTDCIYSTLKIHAEEATLIHNDVACTVTCEWKDDQLVLMFTAPIQFSFKLLPENKMLLWRQYNKYDGATRKTTALLIHLIYNKQ